MTFARKLRYGAHDGEDGASFMALIEFTKKKGGSPIGFVIYFRVIQYSQPQWNQTKMFRFEASSAEEAIQRFWPWGEIRGREFPRFESDKWKKTTRWLDRVALGYEGMWVRVGTPSPCSARRNKKLQFGNISQILHLKKLRLKWLEEESGLFELQMELSNLEEEESDENDGTYVLKENREAHTKVLEEIDAIQAVLSAAKEDVLATRCEMRYVVRKMFPEPLGKLRKRDLRIAGLLLSRR